MHYYPLDELLNVRTIFEEFDEARIKKFIQ